jgi:hypothetical protein
LTHADAAPPHLPPSCRRSAAASPLLWLTQVQRCPPSLVLLLAACAQPALRSFPTSCCCSLRSPSRSTAASTTDDPGGAGFGGEERGDSCTASPYRFPLLLARRRGRLTPCERALSPSDAQAMP